MIRTPFLIVIVFSLTACRSPETDSVSEPVIPDAADVSSPEYRIRLDPDKPLRMHGELDLLRFPGKERFAQARGTAMGITSQIRVPQCDGSALPGESPDGPWAIPDDCQVLSWEIEVASVPVDGLDASRQQTVYFQEANWWLLSEPSSLLRVTGAGEDVARSMRIETGDSSLDVMGRRAAGSEADLHVPPTTSPPEFHVIGSRATERHSFGQLVVDYVLDDPERVAELPLAEAHVAMLGFLLELLKAPESLPDADSRLLVVWLGIDAAVGHAGGAAGGRSFLANYIDGDPESQALNSARTLMILGHEQFHQLHDLVGDGPPLPTWFGESLAQYYALRALQHSGLPEEIVQRAVGHFIDPERPVEHGLLALQTMYEQGDPEAYDQFYYQGATFWSEVHRVLRESAPAEQGLDELAPRMVRAGGDGEGLPAALRQQLLELGGQPMEAVLEKYL